MEKIRPLMETPRKNYFCGSRKFLKLYRHSFRETSFPVMENESYFLLVTGGRGQIIINGISFALSPGVVCWIQCSHVVSIEPALGQRLEIQSIVYDYVLSNFLMFRSGGSDQRMAVVAGSPVMYPERPAAAAIARLFARFDEVNSLRDYGSSLVKVALLGRMSLEFGMDRFQAGELNNQAGHFPGWWAAVYIAMHSRENIDAESVAGELGTDPVSMNRQLRAVTGLNFEQMLCRNRCILASSFFMCENMSFDYIAINSGFKTEVSFFRNFKKIMGVTAGEYRDMNLCSGRGSQIYRGMIKDDRLIAILKYLYNNSSEQLSLNRMANETFISPNIIRNLIDKNFGLSYKDILCMLRIRNAEALLSSSDLYLLDIAVLSGFNNISTFSRRFKAVNGISPGEYRQQCREERE